MIHSPSFSDECTRCRDMEIGETCNGMLIRDLACSIRLLQGLGFYTAGVPSHVKPPLVQQLFTEGCLVILTVCYMGINSALLGYNIYAMYIYSKHYGMWDAETLMIVISGMKPLQCLINHSTFTFRRLRHKQLYEIFSKLDDTFRKDFALHIDGRQYNALLIGAAATVTVSCLVLRTVQYVIRGEVPGYSWHADASFLIIVGLGLWQVLPILYFFVCNRIIQYWLNGLNKAIMRQRSIMKRQDDLIGSPRYSMPFLVDTYFQLVSAIKAVDRIFNVFILLSVARCVTALCMMVYFFSEATTILHLPDNLPNHIRINVFFNVGWCILEILLVITYIMIIAYSGTKTNETARSILGTVLKYPARTDDERFQVYLLTQKVSTQGSWGISAWRAFPIERTFGFTLISGILTFFFLIKKLKNTSSEALCAELSGIHTNITNTTTA